MDNRKHFSNLCKRQKNRRLAAMCMNENVASTSFINVPQDIPNIMNIDDRVESIVDDNSSIASAELENILSSSDDESMSVESESDHNDIAELEDHIHMNNNNIHDEKTLKAKLCVWALMFGISHTALNALLLILQIYLPMEQLPKDARTLLNTPRKTIIRKVTPGTYFHYGLLKAITDTLKFYSDHSEIDDTIYIDINIDGLPLAKSSKSQLWPILGKIKTKINSWRIFIIGIYHGNKKPVSVTEFLEDFVTEYIQLMNEGFEFVNKHFRVKINAVICDSPARAFVKCVKGHNAYFGCEHCIQEGDYIHNRILYLNDNCHLRTDDNFIRRDCEDHHVGMSPFEMIPLKMVTQFSLDYMHLCCLGVMKKLITLWLRGHHVSRLNAAKIQQLSDVLVSLANWVPEEFQRKCRSLNELDRWKATEFRLFLLYLGPVVMKSFLPTQYYKHFNAFNCAIRILCDPKDCFTNNTYAKDLLVYFVRGFKILYGEQNMVYNVHNLIHINEDAKIYGPLDSFSAFPFESYMQKIKKLLRKSEAPLAQIHRRICEQSIITSTDRENNNYPFMRNSIQQELPFQCIRAHRTLHFSNFTFSLRDSDNCCYLYDGSIVVIDYFGYRNEEPVILGKYYINPIPIEGYPCNSQNLNIYEVKELSNIRIWPIQDIKQKAFRLPYNDMYIVMPLLHCTHTQ